MESVCFFFSFSCPLRSPSARGVFCCRCCVSSLLCTRASSAFLELAGPLFLSIRLSNCSSCWSNAFTCSAVKSFSSPLALCFLVSARLVGAGAAMRAGLLIANEIGFFSCCSGCVPACCFASPFSCSCRCVFSCGFFVS